MADGTVARTEDLRCLPAAEGCAVLEMKEEGVLVNASFFPILPLWIYFLDLIQIRSEEKIS